MNIKIHHLEASALEHVIDAIAQGEIIRRSPHVGNVPEADLRLIFGLATMGANLHLELVDTIQGEDQYSNPRYIISDSHSPPITSRNQANSRVVGACLVNAEGAAAAESLGLQGISVSQGDSLADVHLDSLRQTLPEEVQIQLSSQLFHSIGSEALHLAIQEAQPLLSRPIRAVRPSGKIGIAEDDMSNLFGGGEQQLEGVLPPLEVMIALEIVEAAVRADGADSRLTHVAGRDMIRYTKDAEVMEPVKHIVAKVAAELGLAANVTVEYCLPFRHDLLDDPAFPQVLRPGVIKSQYDLMEVNVQEAIHAI